MLEEKKDFKENKPLMFLIPVFGIMMCIMCVVLVQQCILAFTDGGDAIIGYAMSDEGQAKPLDSDESTEGWSFYDKDVSEDGWDYYVPPVSESSGSQQGEAQIRELNHEPDADLKGGSKNSDFNPIISESEPVSNSYFKNALFLGDSRTQGLQYQCGINGASYITDVGMNVGEFFDRKAFPVDGRMCTMAEAVSRGDYDKVYIMFGINEVGWIYEDIFIEDYEMIIEEIKKSQPDAVIYIQSVLQCTREKAEEDEIFGKKRINYYNRLLRKLAKKENVYFLDINEVLVEKESGILPDDASPDGIHLNYKYCKKWMKYLKTHTVRKEEGNTQ